MASNITDEDYEKELLNQIEREFEEQEKKKKDEKKSKKKGGRQNDEQTGDAAESQSKPEEKETKKEKDKKKGKKKNEESQVEKVEDEVSKIDEEKKPEVEQKKEPAKDKKKKDENKKTEKKAEPAKPTEAAKPEKPNDAQETKAESSGKKDDKKKGAKKATGPSKLIKEALAKQLEAEEKIRREEEEKQKKEEQLLREKEERERKEKEKKEKKKLKEKERIKRKKEEGTFLTKAQKEEKERAYRQLQALGISLPTKTAETDAAAAVVEEKKVKPKYERLRKKQQTTTEEEAAALNGAVENLKVEEEKSSEEVHEVKDNWDEESEEETQAVVTKGSVEKKVERKDEDEGDEDSDEEDGEDEDESSEEESSEEESESDDELPLIERIRQRIRRRHEEFEKERSTENLRAPVICVLGHVDTGKTKLLDNLRRTRVQEDEAGGITQQIGATNVPFDTINERTRMCRHVYKNQLKLPGLLIIDTPGHESFKSLRSRGSSLCDIAILVVDIMHGLEPQTIESIKLLMDKKTKFIVALNKIDRLFEWKKFPDLDIIEVLGKQQQNTKFEFERRSKDVILQLAEQGLNAALFYENPDPNEYISLVPTSAHSSDGTGNLIALIIETCQTVLAKRLSYSRELNCSVLEVKVIPSLGTTIDVCVVNGQLKVCDTIIVAGQEGPIVTQIRGLLVPAPNRDLRTKNSYVTQKEVLGAQGVKIAAKGLEKAMPGLPLFVAKKDDEIEYYKEELQGLIKHALSSIKLSDVGVFVQASTLGSLEALLDFLRTSKVPYAGINIGPIHKKDVTRTSIMLEKDSQWAVILAFDVRVEREAQDLADHLGVKIFTADIIYHLFDKFIGYRDELKRKKREEFKDVAVFPCKLKIMPEFVFNKRDPIVVGVRVEAGFVKIGTPIVALCEDNMEAREFKDKFVDLGRVSSIEFNHKPLEVAKVGQEVCIKIDNTTGGAPKLLGRHFTEKDLLISKISRESIDAVKDYFREEMAKPDWELIISLKKLFQII